VEAALRGCPGVDQAVAVMREDDPGDRKIVAYVKTGGDLKEVRRLLRQRLPDYMTPAAIVSLPCFPTTDIGKVDRENLPPPPETAPDDLTAPENGMETLMLEIWSDVLKTDAIGVDQDFFEIGGHSLLANTVINRIRQDLNIEIPLRVLFERPTIRTLCNEIVDAYF